MNKIIIIGYLGRDPEYRYTANGTAVASFSVAENRRYKTAAGEERQETEWFNCSAFGRLAEVANQYLGRGQQVYLEGRLTSRQYERRDGTAGYSLDVMVSDLQFLGRREGEQSGGGQGYGGSAHSYGPGGGGGGQRPSGQQQWSGAGSGASPGPAPAPAPAPGNDMDVDDLPF